MAYLIRSAKSGSYWTINELIAFNITVVPTDYQTFFSINELPPPGVPDIILRHEKLPDELQGIPKHHPQRKAYQFFGLLADAMSLTPGQESAVDDFAVFLLEMLDLDEGPRVIHSRREMGFIMCGQRVDTKTDVCVMQRIHGAAAYILLVQEDKRHMSKDDAEAQLIAESCAAFSENNRLRAETNLPQLASMTFPGVTLVGARPTFYKITVTAELLLALATAQYPAAPTIVEKLVPPVPDIHSFNITGMQQPNNRVVALQCFQALKNLVHNFNA